MTEVDWTSEYFTFRSVWNAAFGLRQAAESDDVRRRWLLMASLVLAHTAYEGLLNHLIENLYPDVWAEEQTFFRRRPFQGTLGKTRFLASRVGLSLSRGARPYRTVAELHSWRNALVHPRTVRGSGVTWADAYARSPKGVHPAVFAKLSHHGFVDRCFEDVVKLGDALLRAATECPTADTQGLNLGSQAFWGPPEHGGASLRR